MAGGGLRRIGPLRTTAAAGRTTDGRGTASGRATESLVSSSRVGSPVRPGTIERTGAGAEWVRALPVGNGRLGAMVFGGVVHERLQLNEDTLWAGRPYDPVNPEAKDGASRGQTPPCGQGLYRDAAQLVSQKVMAKPLAQMPYQTLGDLTLTFPQSTRSSTIGAIWT